MRQGRVCRYPAIHIHDSVDDFINAAKDADMKHTAFLQKLAESCGELNPSSKFFTNYCWEKEAGNQYRVARELLAIVGGMEGHGYEEDSVESMAVAVAQQTAAAKGYVHFVLPLLRLIPLPEAEKTLVDLLVGTSICSYFRLVFAFKHSLDNVGCTGLER